MTALITQYELSKPSASTVASMSLPVTSMTQVGFMTGCGLAVASSKPIPNRNRLRTAVAASWRAVSAPVPSGCSPSTATGGGQIADDEKLEMKLVPPVASTITVIGGVGVCSWFAPETAISEFTRFGSSTSAMTSHTFSSPTFYLLATTSVQDWVMSRYSGRRQESCRQQTQLMEVMRCVRS